MSTNTKTNDVRMFRVRPARVALACGVMLTWPATANDRNPVDPPLPRVIENAMLRISFPDDPSSGTGSRFEVLDKRAGRVWRTAAAGGKAAGFLLKGNTASFDLMLPQHPDGYRAVFTLEPDRPELTVELQGPAETEINSPVFYPPAFASEAGDRVIVPINQGISYPADVADPPLGIRNYYSGHGISMAFFAATEDRLLPSGEVTGKAAYMVLNETPDNSGIELLRTDNNLLTVRQAWGADRGRFGYARRIRIIFFDGGGHVAICKRYRRYAQERGLVVPFTEKQKQNPARGKRLGLLFGAANIWVLSGRFSDEHQTLYDEISGNYRPSLQTQQFMDAQQAIYRDMRTNGMDRLLIGAGADEEHVRAINAIDGALSSRYDIYQDVMDPALYNNLTAIKHEWPKEAFPHDLRIDRNGRPAQGWKVPLKNPVVTDGKTNGWTSCTQLCDRQALPYARQRITAELQAKPYSARFIDVTACSTWQECWSPAHPMTRSEARACKAQLLDISGKDFNLVFGSETGHEAFVPMCDYFEGMISLVNYRVPDSGRDMTKIWHDVPHKVATYQTGEAYRLPLFELVFHDCVVSYWYWGDYNNKLPALWGKRDLFNALYGAPPMYVVTPDNWPLFRERIFASYRIAEPVSKLTATSEMTEHRILTADRTVQQSAFANGVRVTVNFGKADFKLADGNVIKAGQSRIE